jgi:Ca2+/Na+ antiporter
MVHGIGLGGAALLGLAAALFYLYAARPTPDSTGTEAGSRAFAMVTVFSAVMLWLTVIIGTYIIFPPYRATPPPGATDLSQFPRALVLANPNTAWLHAFAMEIKEHMPWIASMLTTAVAFIVVRYPGAVLRDPSVRRMVLTLLAIAFVLVAGISLLGVFVNKVAPLD